MLAWPLVRRPGAAFVIGCAVIVAGIALSYPMFDTRALSVFGFVAHKPITDDYVPLAPWAGVVFIGIALGNVLRRALVRRGRTARGCARVAALARSAQPCRLHGPSADSAGRAVARGRH